MWWPFSPSLLSWQVIGQAPTSRQGPAHTEFLGGEGRSAGCATASGTDGAGLLAEQSERAAERAPGGGDWALRGKDPLPSSHSSHPLVAPT